MLIKRISRLNFENLLLLQAGHMCCLYSTEELWHCSNYKSSRGKCQIHYIRDVVPEQIVLETVLVAKKQSRVILYV